MPCDVVGIEKRRDGGTRYWCRAHRADATARGDTMAVRWAMAKALKADPNLSVADICRQLGASETTFTATPIPAVLMSDPLEVSGVRTSTTRGYAVRQGFQSKPNNQTGTFPLTFP